MSSTDRLHAIYPQAFNIGETLVHTKVDPRLAIGTKLVVDIPLPPAPHAEKTQMLRIGVIPGKHAPRDATAFDALLKTDGAFVRGHGGTDLEEVFELEDLAKGTWTVCGKAEARTTANTPSARVVGMLAFKCRQIEIAGTDDVHELKLEW